MVHMLQLITAKAWGQSTNMVLLFSSFRMQLELDGTALVNVINSKVGIMIRAVKQERVR